MKVLILTDGLGWIVDRITDKIIREMDDVEFIRREYTVISTEELVDLSKEVDLVHYNNWDLSYHLNGYKAIKTPFLYTVRSFRYPAYTVDVARWATKTLVINEKLLKLIPNSVYVPDAIFEEHFTQKPFVVGYAGMPDDYKGFNMIRKACFILGCQFKHAFGIKPEDMPAWYDSIDLYVCASVNEGFSTPVMECLARNKPVVTVKVGAPADMNLHFAERNVESLCDEIGKFYTRPLVEGFQWRYVTDEIKKIYNEII